MDFRIGIGQDSHRFTIKKKELILGGFQISNYLGLDANSDGDVIIHALCNALLTAIGEGSFSVYADPLYQSGISDSTIYLKQIVDKVKIYGFVINNISITVEAGRPQLEKYNEKIRRSLSKSLHLSLEQVGLSFTSGEKLTSFGKGQGIQAIATVLLVKK